ncbi:MAG TPA: aminoglycoside phosphotransferase family protein [Pseudonocardiaceae bacterium]|nr:aminoglycoside phosphotransferase family protein [Pseudonocardiaceae bacterium]
MDDAMTPETANQVLDNACRAVGLDANGAELIRIGSNAVYRLRKPVIVRIAQAPNSFENARKQVEVAQWLESAPYPATRAVDVAQPVETDERVVTFWVSVSEKEEYAPISDVAELIRRLHQLPMPASLALPRMEPFEKVGASLSELGGISREDSQFLSDRSVKLRHSYARLRFELPMGPIHGDANVGNVIVDRQGQPVLIDLDSFCVGPREWDLIQTALFYDRFGWHTADEYRTFVAIYGYDVMTWDGYEVLADLRELMMTLWLARQAGVDDRASAEVHKRVVAMETGGSRHDWAPF